MTQDNPIEEAAGSADEDRRLEGRTAQVLRAAGVAIVSFDKRFGPGGSHGETDIETARTLVEVTTAPARKGNQIDRLMNDARLNPDNKAVILYAPNYGETAAKAILRKGAHVARKSTQLVELVRRLGG